MAHRALALGALGWVMAACGGAGGGGGAGPPKEADPAAATGNPAPKSRVDDVTLAKVFDANGAVSRCALPGKDCPDVAPDREFLDHCRLAGFQIRQCGCEARCTGDVAAARRRYDA